MEVRHTKWLFQNATEIGNGEPFLTGRNNELTVYITGDSSSRTIFFEGADAEENWFPVSATKIPENTQAISTTGTNEVWSIPLSRWHAIRCRISAINGGSVRITGRAVSNESSSLTDIPNIITSAIDQTTDETTNRVVAKISQVAGENVVKATDLETLITTLNGKIDTLDAVIDTIKDTIIDKVTVETTGISDVFTLLNFLDVPGYGDEIDVSKYGMVRVHITKNNHFNGTLTFQGLVSGSAYKNILVRNVNTGILVETIPSPNPPLVISEDYLVDVRGLSKIRIQATYTSAGDVSATGRCEPWTEIQYVNIANDQPISMQLSGSNLSEGYIIPMFDLLTWSGFTNQPDGDDVEIVSNSASDTGKCTVFYTKKSDGTFAYTTVTLTGTNAIALTGATDVDDVLGVFLGDIYGQNITPAVGTITLREASADQAITTIVAGKISKGMVVFDLSDKQIILNVHSGNVWKRCSGVVSTTTGFKMNLTGGNIKEEKITSMLYLISDTTGATAQIEVLA